MTENMRQERSSIFSRERGSYGAERKKKEEESGKKPAVLSKNEIVFGMANGMCDKDGDLAHAFAIGPFNTSRH